MIFILGNGSVFIATLLGPADIETAFVLLYTGFIGLALLPVPYLIAPKRFWWPIRVFVGLLSIVMALIICAIHADASEDPLMLYGGFVLICAIIGWLGLSFVLSGRANMLGRDSSLDGSSSPLLVEHQRLHWRYWPGRGYSLRLPHGRMTARVDLDDGVLVVKRGEMTLVRLQKWPEAWSVSWSLIP